MTEILASLVEINSVNPEWGGPGEAAVADWVKRFFDDRGIGTTETEVLPGRKNVIARVPGKDPSRCLVFEAHMDTVATDGMVISPFDPKIENGRLYGRGSVDVKAGLAAMMLALSQVKKPPCDIVLGAVVDEEHAYRGVLSLIDDLDNYSRCTAVVAEPTGNRVVRANKGVLRWRIQTRGKAAHSSKPHLGENAIYEMGRVLEVIEKDNKRLSEKNHPLVGPATCCVGLISGGTQVNVVPEKCEITLDRRMLPGEKADDVLEEYRQLISPFRAEMSAPDLVDEAMETPESSVVVQTAMKVLAGLGGNPDPIGVPFGCDVTKLSRAGIPGIIFGPGSIDQAHAAVEYVDLSEVEFAAAFYGEMMNKIPAEF